VCVSRLHLSVASTRSITVTFLVGGGGALTVADVLHVFLSLSLSVSLARALGLVEGVEQFEETLTLVTIDLFSR
jgi:hypothetical protein